MSAKHENVEALFDEALKLQPEERKAFVSNACADNPGLRRQLEELLRAADNAGDFLPESPNDRTVLTSPVTEQPGDRIGRYKLLEKIGEGGCGIVYMAEQEEPVRRKVALKVIKPGMDSRQVIARFEAERQALAMMDHPSIAKVYDGGVTESGRPYFVMELVRGVKVTSYCQENELPVRARLDLFIAVCSAVQHAHQKGIIHRDLKPSNILVTEIDGKPVPKVIDFGIARATEQKLTDKTLFTQFAQFLGTPAYMSPEQAAMSGTDIDTRSDIYSLGVLLYELLTGTTPFDARELLQAGFDEMRRIIRETEPPTPSRRVESISRLRVESAGTARVRLTSAQKAFRPLNSQLKSLSTDLDWIVMKCLEKNRSRRYETASGLASDIARHLNNEPVAARPPGAWYRFGKMVKRNKGSFLAGSAILAALVAGTVVSIWQARVAERRRLDAEAAGTAAQAARDSALAEKQRAGEQAAIATAVSEFFREDVIRQAGSRFQAREGFTANPNLTVREAVDRAAERIGDRFKTQPVVEAAIRRALALAYIDIGLAGKAIPHLDRACALFAEHRGPGHADTLDCRHEMGSALHMNGQADKAVPILEDLLERMRKLHGPDYDGTLRVMYTLSVALVYSDKVDEGVQISRDLLERQRRTLGPDDSATLQTMIGLASYCRSLHAFDEAAALYEEAVGKLEKVKGPNHPGTVDTRNALAVTWARAGHWDKALPVLEETIEQQTRIYGRVHPTTLASIDNLADGWARRKEYDKAIPLYEEALAGCRKLFPANHPDLIDTLHALALALYSAKRAGEALPLFDEALPLFRERFGPEGAQTLTCMKNLALACTGAGELERAAGLFSELLEIRRRQWGNEHPDTIPIMEELASVVTTSGRSPEAVTLITEIVRLYTAAEVATPKTGNAEKAAEWKQKLTDLQKVPAPPAPAPPPRGNPPSDPK